MANKVTTEWFDLHVKHGNYLPNEKEKTLLQEQTEMQEKYKEEHKVDNIIALASKDQLEDM